jgi:hypothetical protein
VLALDGRYPAGNLYPMFLQFFTSLRDAQVPVTLREYLTLMEALRPSRISTISPAPLW